ncbi:glutathione S-transferase family protein [Mesorhizobium sp. BAC0120]|uniref:glutathione S-transferase family protein n=1 Tax=Mesorhizobium sp. BAC0120 TaxID=3090670 RepID=UPI00298D1F4E|nr:glutathione S-transferase family protein [Mesorhizobium sp. BAC0120]MDW6025260.1 glutathione S-transferase family protein [Mesorhizobium sp. BAC0120]
MSLTLHYHPLASFCWKVLIALYENDTPFEKLVVDLGDEASRAAFFKLWPVGKFPVLQDKARDRIVPESSIVIDYLDQYFPGRVTFVPKDPELARQTRLADRFFDLYVHEPLQKIVGDKIRPEGSHDLFGVERARQMLQTAYALIDEDIRSKTWAIGGDFTLADCSAFPALFYADKVEPLTSKYRNAARYLERLSTRPSVARVVEEAQPYMPLFPFYEPEQA